MADTPKRRVILVTDGDRFALRAVEQAARNLACRCISASAGKPSPLKGPTIVGLIKEAAHDPVIVMVDDTGSCYKGKGEKVLEYVATHPDIEVMGVLAVASNTGRIEGAQVDLALTKDEKLIEGQVDKSGCQISPKPLILGDTVDVLNELREEVPFVLGIGDIGKMDGRDNPEHGAQVTTKAIETIINEWQKRQKSKLTD